MVLLLRIVFVGYAPCLCVLCCRVCSLWPCGHLPEKGWPLYCRAFWFFFTFPIVSWSTSELKARLALWNWFKPSSKIFYWPFQGSTSFVDLLCFFCLVFSIDEMVGAWCFGCLSGPPGFTCWISFAPVFSFIYCWVLCFISLLYLDLYVFKMMHW